MAISESDYPRLTELLTIKHTITLNCDAPPLTEYSIEDEDSDSFIYLTYGGNPDFFGSITSQHLSSAYDYFDKKAREKVLAKRFRTFVQPDGEIGLAISYIPGEPFGSDAEHAKALWDATRISEIMSYEEYISDLKNGAAWVGECLGDGGECYALIVDVTAPGRTPIAKELGFDDMLLEPLWIQRRGRKYNVHIDLWQD